MSTPSDALASNVIWLTAQDVSEIHDDQLKRFGGAEGLKSQALLESAVAAPVNLFYYGREDSCLRLGAHLAHAIVKNHAFVDGNKRTATVALLEFLYLNSLAIELPDSDSRQPLAELMEQLAASKITAGEFAEILRPHMVQV